MATMKDRRIVGESVRKSLRYLASKVPPGDSVSAYTATGQVLAIQLCHAPDCAFLVSSGRSVAKPFDATDVEFVSLGKRCLDYLAEHHAFAHGPSACAK